MNKVTGVVQARSVRDGGSWQAINLKVNEEWYGGYVSDFPKLTSIVEGTKVALEFTLNGKYKNLSAIDVLEEAAPAKSSSTVGKSAAMEDKEWHISLGAGLNQAIALLPVLIDKGIVKLPAKNGYEASLEYVKEIAVDLAKFNFFSEVPEKEEDQSDAAFAVGGDDSGFSE